MQTSVSSHPYGRIILSQAREGLAFLKIEFMKKILTALFVLFSIHAWSQEPIGDDVVFLIGAELKVSELPKQLLPFGYRGFYSDFDKETVFKPHENGLTTEPSSIVGKQFNVSQVSESGYNYIIELTNPETGVVYFDYDSRSKRSYDFPFDIIGRIKYPEGSLCKDLEDDIDKFTSERRIITPSLNPISFSRIITEDRDDTMLYLSTQSNHLSTGGKGAVILLDDGTQFSWANASIDVDVFKGREGYTYTLYRRLNEEEIERLSTHAITDFRLYIYDQTVTKGAKYQQYLKCLIEVE